MNRDRIRCYECREYDHFARDCPNSSEETRHIYKKVETGESINADMIQQEVEQEKQLNKLDNDSGEENPYRELVVNNAEKIEVQKTQMEQWSILK